MTAIAEPSALPAARRVRASRVRRVGAWCVPLIMLSALFQNYYDLQSVMSGESLKIYQAQGPIVVRALKDISYALIGIAIIVHAYRNRVNALGLTFFSILTICLSLAIISSGEHGALTAALGMRWAAPLILFIMMKEWTRGFDGRKSFPWIYGGLFVCMGLQVYQLFNMPPVYGTIFGLSARTPGIFLVPNSASFFGCACAAFIHVYSRNSFRHSIVASLLALAISALAQSGAGVIACFALLMHSLFARAQILLFVGAIAAALLAFLNLDALLFRSDFVEISGGGRVERFWEIVRDASFSLNNFGDYTNAANLANSQAQFRKAVDSLVASMIGNFGAMLVVVLIILGLFVFRNFKGISFATLFSPLVVFIVFALTTIIFEAYPMNILLALTIWGMRNVSMREQVEKGKAVAQKAQAPRAMG